MITVQDGKLSMRYMFHNHADATAFFDLVRKSIGPWPLQIELDTSDQAVPIEMHPDYLKQRRTWKMVNGRRVYGWKPTLADMAGKAGMQEYLQCVYVVTVRQQ